VDYNRGALWSVLVAVGAVAIMRPENLNPAAGNADLGDVAGFAQGMAASGATLVSSVQIQPMAAPPETVMNLDAMRVLRLRRISLLLTYGLKYRERYDLPFVRIRGRCLS
jgi:hypothetical protein